MRKTQARDVLPLDTTKQILLVNPAFPISAKSRNHKDYLPIGLLKIASWLQNNDYEVKTSVWEQGQEADTVHA